MDVNSNLLGAHLESRTKTDIAGFTPALGRVLYDASGNVIRIGDGSRFRNSSDLELRTSAELATDGKYLGATRYDSTANVMVCWNGSNWVPASAGDFVSKTSAQIALETPVSGRGFYNSTLKEIAIANGVEWKALEFKDYTYLNVNASATIDVGLLTRNSRVIITVPCALSFSNITLLQYKLEVKCLATLATISASGGTIDGTSGSRTIHQYQTVNLAVNPLLSTELLVW
jgi:hypothetical protein